MLNPAAPPPPPPASDAADASQGPDAQPAAAAPDAQGPRYSLRRRPSRPPPPVPQPQPPPPKAPKREAKARKAASAEPTSSKAPAKATAKRGGRAKPKGRTEKEVEKRERKESSSSSSSESEAESPAKKPKKGRATPGGAAAEGRTGGCASGGCLAGRSAAVHPESSMASDGGAGGTGQPSAQPPNPAPNPAQPPDPRDAEMGRLQQMLEARGLPSHILGALGPRIGGLLGSRAPNPGPKVQGLLAGMGKEGDESAQLTAVMELCNLLVMGNEETLGSHFPVREVVKALLRLMEAETNLEMMVQAVRGLSYLMEALPRSTPIVVEAVPALIARLDRMECMDAAEQALTALETLSKRHAKAVLAAGGVRASLAYLDFFSSVPQRTALSIAAHCAAQVGHEDLPLVLPSLPDLAQRLGQPADKKALESICAFFTRLVDNVAPTHPKALPDIASPALLANVQTLLVQSPAVVSTGVFMSLLRMLHLLCAYNSGMAVALHAAKMGETLRLLLVGPGKEGRAELELVQRSAQELHELVILIGELMPRLPSDGSFAVQGLLRRDASTAEAVLWSWKEDTGHWRPYTNIDSRILEAAYQAREAEVSLQAAGSTYTVDLENMVQVNDDSGYSRPLQRRVTPLQAHAVPGGTRGPNAEKEDARLSLDREALDDFVRQLFPVLYEVYASTAGPGIRHDCLSSMLRMVHHSSPELLREVLKSLSVSSHIANMLSSSDLKIVVGALQLVRCLLDKVPDIFVTYFRREGVMHQVQKLTKAPLPLPTAAPTGLGSKAASEPVLPTAVDPTASLAQNPFLVGSAPNQPMPLYGLLPTTNAAHGAASLQGSPAAAFGGLLDSFGGGGGPAFLPAAHLVPGGPPCRFNSVPGGMGGAMAAGMVGAAEQPAGWTSDLALASPAAALPAAPPPPPPPQALQDAEMEGEHRPDSKGPEVEEGGPSNRAKRKETRATKRRSERNNNDGTGAGAGPAGGNGAKAAAGSSAVKVKKEARKGSGSSTTSSGHMTTRSRAKQPPPGESLKASAASAAASRRSASTHEAQGPTAGGKAPAAGAKARAATASNYLADKLSSLPLPRWARPTGSSGAGASSLPPAAAFHRRDESRELSAAMMAFGSAGAAAQLAHSLQSTANKEKVRTWIREQAAALMASFFEEGEGAAGDSAVLAKLASFAQELECGDVDLGTKPLESLVATVVLSDVSSFEILHSGIIPALRKYLTAPDPSPLSATSTQPSSFTVLRTKRLKRFLNVFLGIQESKEKGRRVVLVGDGESEPALGKLVGKLLACLSQVEQFPVKVHDLPGSGTGHGAALRGTSALRFFHTHQIKCILRRHPEASKQLKDWHRGPIKVDPLAQMSAIERYMLMKGYGRLRSGAEEGKEAKDGSSTDDGASEDELEETLGMVGLSSQHRIQFLIGDRVLPYEMTLYQAVRQFSHPSADSDADQDLASLSYASIWVNTHTLFYRLAPDHPAKAAVDSPASPNDAKAKKYGLAFYLGRKGAGGWKGSSKSGGGTKAVDVVWTEGKVAGRASPLSDYLDRKVSVSEEAAGNEVLGLLRVLYGLNRHWTAVFRPEEQSMKSFRPVVSTAEWVSGKLSQKVLRQLQDPLTVLSQQIPSWVRSLAASCPFLLSFEARQCVFYATALDRDRALQRLIETGPETASAADGPDGQRVGNRIERRKVCIGREELLKQAEAVLNSMEGSQRAVLEVQYQNEEGTGLGPTLEFYALVSKELQKNKLQLWRETVKSVDGEALVVNPAGLYPAPLSRVVKQASVARTRSKFAFIGRLLARALTDSRMLDLPLSPVLYKWLLGEEKTLGLSDLWELDPTLLGSLQSLLREEPGSVEALELDFTLPGSEPAAELRKGGKDIPVTGENVGEYVRLVCHWLVFEGVGRQMEALVEGFSSVLPVEHLRLFYPEELEQLFCGSSGAWDEGTLAAHIRPDHGYTHDSQPVRWLVEILASLDPAAQRAFLHFITGSPKLPVGGFKALSPPLTVVRKGTAEEAGADAHLPSVMTCVNYLKLPPYSSKDLMATRLATAIHWGQTSFHLS